MAVWQQIDIDRDAVVEASAGTGKTYTLERLVGRYLVEKKLAIGQLLLVTYTEKAAGEMKSRIREYLAEQIRHANPAGGDKKHLQTQLEAFDTAAISTIHSFCQGVLREYAFENGQVFDLQLVDESELAESLLREIMRKNWPAWAREDFRSDLASLLEKFAVDDGEALLETILEVSRKTPADVDFQTGAPPAAALADARQRLLALGAPPFATRYRQLKISRQMAKPRAAILDEVDAWLLASNPELAGKIWPLAESKTFFKQDGQHFKSLIPPLSAWGKNAPNDQQVMPELSALVETLDELKELFKEVSEAARYAELEIFTARTLRELRGRIEAVKAERGLMTYDDMLVRVREALDAGSNPNAATLVAALRQRYRVALVDEFQDTDPVQWDIFRRLFHESDDHRLIVVGDPKQAIYSFRGADLHTYRTAKDSLAKRHNLPHSYRSTRALLEVFNHLFASQRWFGKGGIEYAAVAHPGGNGQDDPFVDTTGRAPVVAVDLVGDDAPTGQPATPNVSAMAHFAAAEIGRYLAKPEAFLLPPPDQHTPPRSLRYSDFCILVRTRNSAAPFERALRKARIPYSFYKKPGVYQSDEAVHIQYMLALLAEPGDEKTIKRALMSRFFGFSAGCLANHRLGADSELQTLLEHWLPMSQKREWGSLFASLMSETGLLLRESQKPDGERRIANYRQIFEELETAAVDLSLDILGLRKLVAQRIKKHVEIDEEADRHRLETEADTVRIMTMHASKGLQFPIVFIGDKSKTNLASRQNIFISRAANGRRMVSLRKQSGGPIELHETLEEQKRVFYVALTRARFRVYLPYAASQTVSSGKTYFDSLTNPAIEEVAAQRMGIDRVAPAADWPGDGTAARRDSPADPATGGDNPAGRGAPAVRFPAIAGSLYPYQRRIDSFTSLARHAKDEATGPTERKSYADDEQATGAADEIEPPPPAPATTVGGIADPATKSLFPAGKIAGNIFHDVMEALARGDPEEACKPTFASVAETAASDRLLAQPALADLFDRTIGEHGLNVRPQLDDTGQVVNSTRHELAAIVWRVLRTSLPQIGTPLAAIPTTDMRAEMEFHFSEGEHSLGRDPKVDHWRRGLLKGFIDLLFAYRGKIYLLDWKTNTLDTYDKAAIEQAMVEADYMLQYRIYALAVLAWLRQTSGGGAATYPRGYEPRNSCEPGQPSDGGNAFGGVYYLFVRGMRGGDDRRGIYFDPWHPDKEADYRRFVLERLRPS